MMAKEIPPHVQAAIYAGDVEQLRISGSVGGRRAGEKKRKRKADQEALTAYFSEKLQNEEHFRRLSTNEHVLPFDPETHEGETM
jgi:hypothetical protein